MSDKSLMMRLSRFFSFLSILIVVAALTGCSSWSAVQAVSGAVPTSESTAADLQLPAASPTGPPTLTPTPVVSPTPQPTTTPTRTPHPTATQTPQPAEIKHVVLISIDGLRPDALDLADTPILDGLRAAGSYSPNAQAVLPAVTLINHASMLGGMVPEKHGINWNVLDLEAGSINGPTLFTVAYEAGLSSVMIVGKPKLDHLVLPDSVTNFYHAGYTDRPLVAEAVAVIAAGMPDILFIHLPDVDSAGHNTGWMQPEQLETIGATDVLIGEVVESLQDQDLWQHTLFLLTSDHGGEGLAHGPDTPENVRIPWLAVGPGVPVGQTLSTEIMIYDTAPTILAALSLPIPETWDGKPIEEIFVTDHVRDHSR